MGNLELGLGPVRNQGGINSIGPTMHERQTCHFLVVTRLQDGLLSLLYPYLSFRILCARVKTVTCAPDVTPVKVSVSLHPFAFSHQSIDKTHLMVTKPEDTHVISKAQTLRLNHILIPPVQKDPINIFLGADVQKSAW